MLQRALQRFNVFLFFFKEKLNINFRLSISIMERRSNTKALFKRRILHAPNRIAKLTACKMRRLNQLNARHLNSMRVSRIFD